MARPLVLLSNDDGFSSEGLRELRAALRESFDVIVVAPEAEQSAASHALSLHRPLRIRRVEEGVFAVDGTPADCVYIALHAGTLLPRLPDLVVSGLNHGANLGQDVFYSGTVAAAREGALRGIPALAASAHPHADFASAAGLAARIAAALLSHAPATNPNGAPRARRRAVLLNLNVPKDCSGSVVATRLGTRYYEELVDMRTDPRGREYCWIGGPGATLDETEGTDTAAFAKGHAVVSPLVLDPTDKATEALVRSLLAAVPGHAGEHGSGQA
jgi:5'-nucleotidase